MFFKLVTGTLEKVWRVFSPGPYFHQLRTILKDYGKQKFGEKVHLTDVSVHLALLACSAILSAADCDCQA